MAHYKLKEMSLGAIKRCISFETLHYHETKTIWYIVAYTISSLTVYVSEMICVKKHGLQLLSLGELIKNHLQLLLLRLRCLI